jgi:hypothetical protein
LTPSPTPETPPTTGTFGGILPQPQSAPGPTEGLISLEDSPQGPAPELISLDHDNTDKPGLIGKPAQQRAAKADFGLGSDSPGIDVLTNGIKNRTEDALRQSAAVQQDVKDRDTQLKVIREKAANGSQITPDDVSQMAGLSKYEPKNDPSTIWEKLYANQFVNSVMSVGSGVGNVVAQAFGKNPEYVAKNADIAHDIVMRQEIAKSAAEDTEAKVQGQGTFSWLEDQTKMFIPGYSWYNTINAVKGAPTSSYLKGTNVEDQISYLYTLPPSEMHKALRGALDEMSKENPSLARDFAQSVVQYSQSDKFLDNAFTVADAATVVPAGTLARGARVLGGELRGAAAIREATELGKAAQGASEATGGVKEAFKAAVKANAPMESDAGAMLTTMGDIEKGAQVNVQKRVGELFGHQDPLNEGRGMSQLPTLLNPEAVVADSKANLSAVRTQRLLDDLTRNRDNVLSAVQNLSKVDRLPENALQVAIKEAEGNIKDRYNHLGDAIIDFQHTRPEQTASNVGSVTARFGQPDGTLFKSLRDAYQAAVQKYKLPAGSFQVKQEGLGWTVNVTKHLDETTPGVRQALITTENTTPQSLAGQFLGKLRSANDRVSDFQNANRMAVVHGGSGLEAAMKDMAKDVGSLSRKERQALRQVMEKNKTDLDPTTGVRGKFYESQSELEKDYLSLHSRLPTYQESKAYWTFVQLNDLDWTMRNLGVFRDRARRGIENFKLFDKETDNTGRELNFNSNEFNGKLIDGQAFPWDNHETAGIVIHEKGKDPEHFYMSPKMASDEQRTKIKDLLDNGYKIIQTENPVRPVFGERLGNDTTNFIITKDFESKKLDWKQIPYRPGFHTEYPQPWFVKQPNIRKGGTEGTPRHIFEGDTSAMAFNTETEARKYAERMDTARQMLKGDIQGDLGDYLSKNLPFNEKQFKSFFEAAKPGEEAAFNMDQPFLHTYTGKTTVDQHGAALTGKYQNFEDNIRSSYNLFGGVDKKFMGQRDNPLWTVEEKGSELNPVYNLKSAKEVDPFVSVLRGMSNVMRSRFFSDYKIQAVESWVQEFGDLLKVDKHDLLNNPVYHVQNPAWNDGVQDKMRLAAAKNSRAAMMELLGTPSDLQANLQHVREKVIDSIYGKLGQSASEKASTLPVIGLQDKPGGANPLKVMRAIAFNEKIGMLNPTQFFQNAFTSGNAIAIDPIHGLSGAMSGLLMQGLRHSEDPAVMERLAKIAGSMGMKPEWFKESWAELKKTGIMTASGKHAWRDDMADPSFFQSTAGKWLDKGAILFNEGDRITNLTAWNTAFRKFRTENPTAEITNAVRNQIQTRADLYSANMTRASTASWQQGVWSIPTQFWGYNARLMEQMLSGGLTNSGRLTLAEKSRVMLMNGIMYGVPIGTAGSLTGGVANYYEDIRKGLLDRGINVDDKVIDAFHSGVVGAVGRFITGEPTNLNEKIGPAGTASLRDSLFGDKNVAEVFFGASGSTTKDLFNSLDPLAKTLMAPFRGDEDQYPFKMEDAVNVIRNVATVDSALKHYYAFKTGELITKSGQSLTPSRELEPAGAMTQTEAVLGFLTGATPRKVSDAQLMQKMNQDRDQAVKDAQKQIGQNYKWALTAMVNNQEEEGQAFLTRVSTLMHLAGLRTEEKSAMWTQLNHDNRALIDRIPYDFAFKKAAPDVSAARQDRELQKRENNNQ